MGQSPGKSPKVNGELESEAGKLRQNLLCNTEATMRANGTGHISGHETHSRPLWDVLPTEVLTGLVGGDHSKGKQRGLVGVPVSSTGGPEGAGPDQVADLLITLAILYF